MQIILIYNRSLGSAMIPATEEEKQIFCDLIRKKLSPLPLNVYHYCVTGNHFHFAIEALDKGIIVQIEQNPLRANLVAHAGDWKRSSATSYLNGKEDGVVNPYRHPRLSSWPEPPNDPSIKN